MFGTKDDKVVLLDANTLLVKQTVLLPLSERQPTGNPHEIPVSAAMPTHRAEPCMHPLKIHERLLLIRHAQQRQRKCLLKRRHCPGHCLLLLLASNVTHSALLSRSTVASAPSSKMRAVICSLQRAAASRRLPSCRCRTVSQCCDCRCAIGGIRLPNCSCCCLMLQAEHFE